MITITTTEQDMFLPEDGAQAEQMFLDLLHNPGETWICAFGFTLQPMFDEIKKADAAGVKIHILLDHTQEVGHAEAPKVKDLVASLKNGDVTVTTAGINSPKKSQIWHSKSIVVAPTDGGAHHCWEGSVNFSDNGWAQGNTAHLFRNDEWAQAFITQFEAHRAYAREFEPQYQINN